EVVARYLVAQIQAGVDVVQLFDSWAGILSPDDYERSVLPHTLRVFEALSATGAARIHFFTGNPELLSLAARGCDVVSVDWRVALPHACARRRGTEGRARNGDDAALSNHWRVAARGDNGDSGRGAPARAGRGLPGARRDALLRADHRESRPRARAQGGSARWNRVVAAVVRAAYGWLPP